MRRLRRTASCIPPMASMSVGSSVMAPYATVSPAAMDEAEASPQVGASTGAPTTSAAKSLLRVGEMVAGRFEVLALADWGGMGVVYRARDRVTGGDVALK